MAVNFTLNGEPVTVDIDDGDENIGLLYIMRDMLGVTGPKYGCGVGVCRACTCHVNEADGSVSEIQTCVTSVGSVEGKDLTTIEGLADGNTLHPLQQAWIDFDVSQCGFCQAGQIMTSAAILHNNGGSISDEEIDNIRNVCRCGQYFRIRQAIKSAAESVGAADEGFARLGGADRTETAAVMSQVLFAGGAAGSAVLARSDEFPDALTGATLAMATNAPMLLTAPDRLQDHVLAEIQRVVPAGNTVYLLGGIAALDESVAQALGDAGFMPERIGGANRRETASLVAPAAVADPAGIFVVSGEDFGDALSAAATAARTGGAVLLTNAAGLDAAGRDYLQAHPDVPVYVVGASAAQTSGDLGEVIRGATQFDTGVLLAQRFGDGVAGAALASAETFADALAGGVHSGRNGLVVLLTNRDQLPAPVEQYLGSSGLSDLVVYGGQAAISDQVAQAAMAALS